MPFLLIYVYEKLYMNTAQSNQFTAFFSMFTDGINRLKDNSIAKELLIMHQSKFYSSAAGFCHPHEFHLPTPLNHP